ncbi:MAG: MotA/TolQ/ExbB proton channel family protein [Porphyromonas sp.]|nr:MotA/TolQ/ExbB proton channel family protein [Porphyromonas sp.]
MLLQITTDTLAGAASAMPELSPVGVAEIAPSMTIWDLALKGGWIMVVLLILSLFACYIFVERLLLFRQVGKTDPDFLHKIRDYIREGKRQSALDLSANNKTIGARMIEKGIQRLGRPVSDISAAIENVGNIEVAKLERGLPAMATIASGAPMIGFLGTVTGMIRAFYDMASAGANIDVALLSSGIYEALVTTVGGLVVGILALFAYNYLTSQIETLINKAESDALEFMDLLYEPTSK